MCAHVFDASEGIANAALELVGEYKRLKPNPKKPRNEQLPAHLKRYEVKLPVREDQRICPEHGDRQVIGYDWPGTLKVVPPKLVVRRTGIPKLACPKAAECGLVEAPQLLRSGRRQTLRNECGGGGAGREICLPPAGLPTADSLRALRLDASSQRPLNA